ncbi:MAG: FkbM family methyltransferase [Rhodospirillales bacterium]|jgi:FkbM family methyltransferase
MDNAELIGKYEAASPVTELKFRGTAVKYTTPSRTSYWRLTTFETKEPETVKWIDGFERGDVFVDVGANMGLYSLFAAVHSGARVFSFEPESQNYALLNTNIRLNNAATSVTAWCCALANTRSVDRLYMTDLTAAGSCHAFGAEVDESLSPVKAAFAQGCLGYSLDELVISEAVPMPTHIKIDVDGFEHLVVRGAIDTFANPKLKSVLIEINPHINEHAELVCEMESLGFKTDVGQVERSRRKEGGFKDYGEYIFWR